MRTPAYDRCVDWTGDAGMYTHNHRTIPCIRIRGIRVRFEERPRDTVVPVFCPTDMFASAHWNLVRLVIFDSGFYTALVADYDEPGLAVPRRHLVLSLDDHVELHDWRLGIHAGCLSPSSNYEDALIEFVAEDNETILIPNLVRAGNN